MADDFAVSLKLTADEALVLFEWLAKFNEQENTSFEDAAEQRVLWDLESQLESLLAEPSAANYKELLAEARSRVRDVE